MTTSWTPENTIGWPYHFLAYLVQISVVDFEQITNRQDIFPFNAQEVQTLREICEVEVQFSMDVYNQDY